MNIFMYGPVRLERTWGLVGSAAIGGAVALGTHNWGGSGGDLPTLPPFQNDPLVNQSDSTLFNFGSDVMKGILPTQYQNLMQFNSPQFQAVLGNSNRDIEAAGLQTAALQGNARSGAANAGIATAVGNNSANMRYADYMNTVANQKTLLGLGLDSVQGAGNMALTNQGQENQYALGGYTALLGGTVNMDALAMKGQAATGASIGQGLGSVIAATPYLKNLFTQPGGTGQVVSGGFSGAGDTSYNGLVGNLGKDLSTI